MICKSGHSYLDRDHRPSCNKKLHRVSSRARDRYSQEKLAEGGGGEGGQRKQFNQRRQDNEAKRGAVEERHW